MNKRAYLAIKYHADHSNRERIERITAILNAYGFDTLCVTRDIEQWGRVQFSPGELMERSFEAIQDSDLVVVDLTEKGVGVGIEAGYAYAKHIPILTIAKTGTDISTTLRGIAARVCQYNEYNDLHACFAKILQGFRKVP